MFTATLSCGAGPCPLPLACTPHMAGCLLLLQGTPSPAPRSSGGQMLRRRGEKSVSHTSATLKNFLLKNHLSNISEARLRPPCGQVTWGWSVMGEMEVPCRKIPGLCSGRDSGLAWSLFLFHGAGGGSWHPWALTALTETDSGWGVPGCMFKTGATLSLCSPSWGPSSRVSDI